MGKKLRMAAGPGGGRPTRWIIGPPHLSRVYEFCTCECGTEVDDVDVPVLLDPAQCDGRVFEVVGEAAAADGPKAAAPKRQFVDSTVPPLAPLPVASTSTE